MRKRYPPNLPQNYAKWLFRESWGTEPPEAAVTRLVQICGAFAENRAAHHSVLNYVIVGYKQDLGESATMDGLLSRVGAYLPGTYKKQLAALLQHQRWGANP